MAGAKAGRFEKDFSTSQEALRYYYQDHLGSRIGVADESGAVLATVAYDVWGNATASGIAGYDAESEIRFTGKPMDATGLYYFNARYYDPQSKRFFTEDPIQSGMNWYAYCGNDPVNYTDPDGMREVIDDACRVVWDEKKAKDTRTGRTVDPSTGQEDPRERERRLVNSEYNRLNQSSPNGQRSNPNDSYLRNALGFVGIPYVWDSDDPQVGLDCSGCAIAGVNAVPGVRAINGAAVNANGLYHDYTIPVTGDPMPGDLNFFVDVTGRAYHVQTRGAYGRINPNGTNVNDVNNPGRIDYLSGEPTMRFEIRRWDWNKLLGR